MGRMFTLSEKGRVSKNFFMFNISVILIFSAYDDVALLSSVLNQNESLGTSSQAIIYTTQFLTALVWPQVIIETIGFKFTLALAECCYLIFFLSNAFPSWLTLIPSNYFIFSKIKSSVQYM